MVMPGNVRKSVTFSDDGLTPGVMLALDYMPKNPSGQAWRYQHLMTAKQWEARALELEQELWDYAADMFAEFAKNSDIEEYLVVRMLELAGL